ncbi:Ig-like domain-containing protein [Brevibacillus brevis]|uniref:Ig-like domain-containing protein n=1 Tax=Brevibacillus brevis TaxID=1393 RepID=A0ABY9T930_BREBE|nr:Ig-like domain-containing protein [Brevibacillus brevis]WNC15711.1 Ig-like domain-containing protein [Brevibacillus brevis]
MRKTHGVLRGWQKAALAAAVALGVALSGAAHTPVYAKTEKAEAAQKKLTKLSVDAKTVKLKKEGTQQLTLTAAYNDRTTENVTEQADWSISDSEIATVEAGLVTALQSGKAKIKATYGGKSVTIPVEIELISKLALDQKKLALRSGETKQIVATATYSDKATANVTEGAEWETADSKIATVEKGLVTAVGFGKTKITVTYGGKTTTIPVEVDVISKLALDQKKLALSSGETKQIAATATFSDKKTANVTEGAEWETADSKVATVEKGVVTAVGSGKTKVTVAYGGKTVTIPVEVDVISKLELDQKKVYVKPGDFLTLKLTATLSNGSKVDVTEKAEWTTSDAKVVTVEGGVVTGVGSGKAKLTVKYGGKTVTLPVEAAVISKFEAEVKKLTLKPGESKDVKAMVTYSDKTKADVTEQAYWVSLDQSVAVVEGGKILGVKAGKATIVATYNGKRANVQVTVEEQKQK